MTTFDENKIEISKNINPEEMIALIKSEQIYANRFFISAGTDGVVRIAFADQIIENRAPTIKCSILMTFAGLISLKTLIENSIQAQMSTMTAKPVENKPQREELN